MNVMLDVDGTLADFIGGFYKLAKTFDESIPLLTTNDSTDWDAWSGITHEVQNECWEYIKKSTDFWYNLEPIGYWCFPNGYVRDIAPKYHNDLYVVTARWGTQVKRQTERWISKVCNYTPTVIASNKKHLVARALDIGYSLDDHPLTVYEIGKVIGRHNSYIIDRPYNRGENTSHMPRVKTVAEFFERIGA